MNEHINDITYRGHLIDVWETPDGFKVECTVMDDPITLETKDTDALDWAVYSARQYIDGWKDAGGA